MLLRLPPWLRAAIITAGQTALAAIALWLLDLIMDIQDWVADPTNKVDLSGAGKAFLTIVLTFLAFVVTAAWRALKPPQNTYPETPTETVP